MPKFSEWSLKQLEAAHPDLRRLCERVIEVWDFRVLQSYRSPEEQQRAFEQGRSKARPGQSPHNYYPALAVDLWPYPISWLDLDRARVFAGYVLGVAQGMGIDLVWGGDWYDELRLVGSDKRRRHTFDDLPHFELRGWRGLRSKSERSDAQSGVLSDA